MEKEMKYIKLYYGAASMLLRSANTIISKDKSIVGNTQVVKTHFGSLYLRDDDQNNFKYSIITQRLLDFIIYFYTKNNEDETNKEFNIKMNIDNYIKVCYGSKKSKSYIRKLRVTTKEWIDILNNITIKVIDNNSKRKKQNPKIDIIDKYRIVDRIAYITLTERFGTLLLSYEKKYFPVSMFKIDGYNELSYELCKILMEEINEKYDETRKILPVKPFLEERVSIESLIKKLDSLPSYEHVYKKNRQYFKHIMLPFINAIENLQRLDIVENWSIIDGEEKVIIPDKENLKYEKFINSQIKFSIPNFNPNM